MHGCIRLATIEGVERSARLALVPLPIELAVACSNLL